MFPSDLDSETDRPQIVFGSSGPETQTIDLCEFQECLRVSGARHRHLLLRLEEQRARIDGTVWVLGCTFGPNVGKNEDQIKLKCQNQRAVMKQEVTFLFFCGYKAG